MRHVCLVVLGQAGCLAVGLAMQQRFLVSSVEMAAVNRSLDRFDSEIDSVMGTLRPPGEKSDSAAEAGRLAAALQSAGLSDVQATVTDSQWRVLCSTVTGKSAASKTVRWDQAQAPENANVLRRRGIIPFGDGPHIALAAPFKNTEGYLLLHCNRDAVEAGARGLLGSVAVLSLLTFVWTWALLGVLAYMLLARFHDEAEKDRARSLAEALRQRQDLIRTRDAVVFGLAKLADSRDPETGDHLERISVYSTLLATVLRKHPRYAGQVTPAFVRLIGVSSALHDIGKVGIEDRVLLKRGPLSAGERAEMQSHPAIGGGCLREIEQRLGSSNFLQMAREIALAHHERWDGTGYPNGLRGEEIPLSARIVAIADVYDALSSRRVYKDARPHEECVEIIAEGAGAQFDPEIVEVWLGVASKFADVGQRYAANEGPDELVAPVEDDAGEFAAAEVV